MPTSKAQKARIRAASLDAQYRKALGVEPGQPLPAQIGSTHSAGAARGGRGAARKGRGRRT